MNPNSLNNLIRITDALSGLSKMAFSSADDETLDITELACLIWLCKNELRRLADEIE